MDGNSEVRKHYKKEHYEEMEKKTDIQCEYNFCMEVLGEKCSQLCFYYQNLITF